MRRMSYTTWHLLRHTRLMATHSIRAPKNPVFDQNKRVWLHVGISLQTLYEARSWLRLGAFVLCKLNVNTLEWALSLCVWWMRTFAPVDWSRMEFSMCPNAIMQLYNIALTREEPIWKIIQISIFKLIFRLMWHIVVVVAVFFGVPWRGCLLNFEVLALAHFEHNE